MALAGERAPAVVHAAEAGGAAQRLDELPFRAAAEPELVQHPEEGLLGGVVEVGVGDPHLLVAGEPEGLHDVADAVVVAYHEDLPGVPGPHRVAAVARACERRDQLGVVESPELVYGRSVASGGEDLTVRPKRVRAANDRQPMTHSATASHLAHHALSMVMSGCRLPDVATVLVGMGLSRAEANAEALAAAQFAMAHYGPWRVFDDDVPAGL